MSYQILAYSLSLNQTQQQIDLVGKPITEAQLAQQVADGFAGLCNRDLKGHQGDWVGQIRWVEDPITNYYGFYNETAR